jgi:anti-sigma-K factor RskA
MADRGEISDYILGEMDELDRARFERDMQDDERLRSEVESMRLLVGRIDELGGEAWDYVDSREQEPAVPARAPARRPRVPALRLALGFAAAAVVILVLVLALSSGSTKSSSSRTVQLSALAGAPPSARGTARFIGPETVQMRVEHLPATDVAHFYELWLMTDTTHLVSVGKFRVDFQGAASVSMTLPASPADYRYLNISLQRAGGGTGISNVSLLRGPT